MERVKQGKFTLRDMRDQFMQVMQMGNIGQLASMIPGLNSNMLTKDKEQEATRKMQHMMSALDSMRKEELDCEVELTESRLKRVARGSGVHIEEVKFMLTQHKTMEKMVKNVGSLSNLGNMEQMKRNPQAALKNIQKNMSPEMMQQMGGMGNIMNMARQMQANSGGGGGGQPDPNSMMQMAQRMMGGMGGGGAGGGGMAQMMQQM